MRNVDYEIGWLDEVAGSAGGAKVGLIQDLPQTDGWARSGKEDVREIRSNPPPEWFPEGMLWPGRGH